jgi:hypothetical protein
MSQSNITQNPPLGQMNIEPMDAWFADIGEIPCDGGASGSVNIPWLLSISVSVGNATTAAISKNCVVFTDPEWGETGGGLGKASMIGGGSGEGGGVYVGW